MEKKIDFYLKDLTPEKQRELKDFMGGESGIYISTPFCTIRAENTVQAQKPDNR